MIEMLQVFRCDASVHLPERAPRAGVNRDPMPAKDVPCTRFYPIRTDTEKAWAKATRTGWTAGVNANGRPLQFCPDHAPQRVTP